MNKENRPTVLVSNCHKPLLARLKENVSARPQNPFYKTYIIVPDRYSKTSLELELTKDLGFVFGITIKTLEEIAKDASGISFVDMLMAVLSVGVHAGACQNIANSLAMQLWYGHALESHKNSKCALALNQLANDSKNYTVNADEVHIYGVTALCPLLNDLFFSLCPQIKVAYYVLSPCMHFWSDICSDLEAKRLTRNLHQKHAKAIEEYLYDRSKFLANNATRAREFIGYLERRLDDFEEQYVIKEWVLKDPAYSQYIRHDALYEITTNASCLLDIVHNDLLLLGRNSTQKIDFPQTDTTIQIHKAPTILREIEVLYQYIQQVLPTIDGRIIVFAPDIQAYLPYIQSMFVHSAQVISKKENNILPFLLEILENAFMRPDPSKIMSLFQNQAFQKKCGIQPADLPIFTACLKEFALSNFEEQVILSWITKKDDVAITSSDVEVLGKCIAALKSLLNATQSLLSKTKRSLHEWMRLFITIFENHFEPTAELRANFYTIKQALIKAYQNKTSHLELDLEGALVIFKAALEEQEGAQEYPIVAPIIFATLGEVCALEKDVVCFLGMHEGNFPRSSGLWLRKLGFIHAAKPPYTVSAIDRHLFIEAMLSTKQLYISYQSYAFKEKSSLEPSGIVLDILQILDQACTIANALPSKLLIKDHSLSSEDENVYISALDTSSQLESIPSDIPEVVYFHELSQVAKYPLRAYMQRGLGLYLHEYVPQMQSNEFEAIGPKVLGMLKKQAFTLSKNNQLGLGEQEYRFLPNTLKKVACTMLEEDMDELIANAKSLGLKADEPLTIELSLTCQQAYEHEPHHWKVPAISVNVDGRSVLVAGTLTNVYPAGIVVFEKKSKSAFFKVWPEILLINILSDFIKIQSTVLFVRDAKVQQCSIINPLQHLQEYVTYALDCRKNPSGIYPDLIEDLCTLSEPPAKLYESSEFTFRDEYLKFYLTRSTPQDLQLQWNVWQKAALSLFGGLNEL